MAFISSSRARSFSKDSLGGLSSSFARVSEEGLSLSLSLFLLHTFLLPFSKRFSWRETTDLSAFFPLLFFCFFPPPLTLLAVFSQSDVGSSSPSGEGERGVRARRAACEGDSERGKIRP